MRALTRVALLLICLAAPALAGQRFDHGLIQGDVVLPTDAVARSTVALGYAPANDPATEIHPFCTGTLVTADLLITAAHCMLGARNTHVIFAPNALLPRPPTAKVLGYEIPDEFHGGYDHTEPVSKDNGDIALVRFAGPAPAGSIPLELIPHDYVVKDGEMLTIAGYGHALGKEAPDDRIGILRKAFLRVLDAGYSRTEVQLDGSQGPQNAGGDSGGPALVSIDGRYFLFAICNWGRPDRFSVFAKVRPHLSWLREAAGRLAR